MSKQPVRLLAIDTATENCSVALLTRSGRQPEILEAVTPAGHSKLVHGMIRQLLARHDLGYRDISHVAVDTGPGSFTGVRIGIGVAQGLAYGSGARCLAVDSLAALAADAESPLCLSAIDARMGQVYWSLYRCAREESRIPERLCGPFVSAPADVVALAQSRVSAQVFEDLTALTVRGTGWGTYGDVIAESLGGDPGVVDADALPGAAALIDIVTGYGAASELAEGVPPAALIAEYVRNEIVQK